MTTFAPRVFSGVQPTGNLHLGNYLGAIATGSAAGHDTTASIASSICTPSPCRRIRRELTSADARSHRRLHRQRHRSAEHIIFNQSQVSEHAELAWLLNCVARLGWLNRMTQFKEKAGKHRENARSAFTPIRMLMAADILVYRATHVPVGEDQKQHLELARDIAQKFNNDFADRSAHGHVEFLPAARAADLGAGDAGDEPARRHQENVEVRPVGLFAHQPDRRCRHHRAEDPQGQDRSRAAAERRRGPGTRPEADNLVGIYAALASARQADCSSNSAADILGVQAGPGRPRGGQARADPPRCAS